MGFFDKMFSGLTKTRKNIEDLEEVFRNYDIDSEDFYDELEEMLIMADVGGETTAQIMMDSFIQPPSCPSHTRKSGISCSSRFR